MSSMSRVAMVVAVALALPAAACGRDRGSDKHEEDTAMAAMSRKPAAQLRVTSTSFAAGGEMPAALTCEGGDTSPALAWGDLPPGTRSIAVIVDDPDAPDPAAPKTVWVHWVIYDLPSATKGLAEGAAARLPAGTREGKNDWGQPGYRGPCPPIGRHRYVHKVYALDTTLGDLGTPRKAPLEQAMAGHILARGELIGTYAKKR